MLKQKQTFTTDIFGQTYEFRHDPSVTNNLWIIRRLNQPADELLDQRPVIFPRRRMTHQQMIAWYAGKLRLCEHLDRKRRQRAEYEPE